MTSSENLTCFDPYEPWMFQPTAAYSNSWLTEAFARDETLTRALQKTVSNDTNNNTNNNSDAVVTSSEAASSFQHTPSASGSDPEMTATATATATRRRVAATEVKMAAGGTTKKITKRKPRATKKCQTTFIMADPANFRQMVQQITGVRLDTLQHQTQHQQLIVKPEPKRLTGTGTGLALPTLDTSSFFVDRYLNSQQQQEGGIGVGQREGSLTGEGGGLGQVAHDDSSIGGGGAGYGYESYQSFPTLESGKVMCDF